MSKISIEITVSDFDRTQAIAAGGDINELVQDRLQALFPSAFVREVFVEDADGLEGVLYKQDEDA